MSDAPEHPGEEPSGSSSGTRENFSQQQAKITALKELVRQSETAKGQRTASAQEKAKNIAERLTHLKSKSSRAKHGDKSLTEVHEESAPPAAQEPQPFSTSYSHHHHGASTDTEENIDDSQHQYQHDRSTSSSANAPSFHRADSLPASAGARLPETPGSEKIQLLRRQMEQNRARMAEREHSKRDVELLVTQLKAKFHSSQISLDRSTTNLGRSIGDLSLDHTTTAHARQQQQHRSGSARPDRFQSSADLSGGGGGFAGPSAAPHNFDRERIRYLEQRCAALEKQAEQREQDFAGRNMTAEHQAQIIDLQEQLREKDSLIEARTQAVGVVSEMGRSAEDELEDTRDEWHRSQRNFAELEGELRDELAERATRIASLEEANEILERARFDLMVRRAQEEPGGQIKSDDTAADAELAAKLCEMEQLNESLQLSIREASEAAAAAESSNAARLAQLSDEVARLQLENDELKQQLQSGDSDTNMATLQESVRQLQASNALFRATSERLDAELQEKTLECNVFMANIAVLQDKLKSAAPKSLFSADAAGGAADETSNATTADESGDVQRLRQQLDDANKAAIKTKLKQRQLQKQIDTLRRSDETARQLGELTDANAALGQRVRELEELAAATVAAPAPTATDALLQTTCNNQIEAIRLLEEQKCELTESLSGVRSELNVLRSRALSADELDRTAHVTSHMEAIQQEERLDTYRTQIESLQTSVAAGQAERAALTAKVQRYAAENMELLDRWDKVNKGSSAESIEIVENLTASERMEMEAIERGGVADDERTPQLDAVERSQTQSSASSPTLTGDVAAGSDTSAMSQDLSDSLVQLREESSELMDRIEAFTAERREVLDKMELLQAENERLLGVVAELQGDRERLHGERAASETRFTALTETLSATEAERCELRRTMEVLQSNRRKLCDELNVGQQEQNQPQDQRGQHQLPHEPIEFSSELYDKSLRALEALLESYRRGKDKNAKFDVSKKLAKEAKNSVELVQRLLGEHVALVQRVNELQQQIGQATPSATMTETDDTAAPATDGPRIASLEAELADACMAIQILESERAAVAVEIVALRTELKKGQLDNRTHTDRVQAVEQERDQLQQLVTELKEQHLAVAVEIDGIRTELDETQRDNSTLENRVQSVEQERQILQKLVAEQKDQLIDTITEFQQTIDEQSDEIDRLQLQQRSAPVIDNAHVAGLNDKMMALKQMFDENNDLLEQQVAELAQQQETIATLNSQLTEVYRTAEESAGQLATKDDELSYLQEIIDANRAEERTLHARWQDSEANVLKLETQLAEQLQKIRCLEDRAKQSVGTDGVQAELLEAREQVTVLEVRNREQLEKLKKFAANLKKKNLQCVELTEKLAQMEVEMAAPEPAVSATADSDDSELRNQLAQLEHELQQKTDFIGDLSYELQRLQAAQIDSNLLSDLQDTLELQTAAAAALNIQLAHLDHEKRDLAARLEQSFNVNDDLRDRHAELESNLTTRTSELSAQSDALEALATQTNAKVIQLDELLQQQSAELQTTRSELHSQTTKIEKCKQIIREKNRELKRLQDLTAQLQQAAGQHTPTEAEQQLQQVTEMLNVERQRLAGQQLKVAEHESFIDSLHADQTRLHHRIAQLEQSLGDVVERAERKDADFQRVNEQFARLEASADATALEYENSLKSLTMHLETVESHLADTNIAYSKLEATQSDTQSMASEWQQRYTESNARVVALNAELADLVDQITSQTADIIQLNAELQRTRSEFAQQLAAKHAEIDTLENDMSVQLQEADAARRSAQDECARQRDANVEQVAEAVRLQDIISTLEQTSGELERDIGWLRLQNEGMLQDQAEVQELRMQCVHDQTEIENLQQQAGQVTVAHEAEVAALRQQLAELDSLRTQIGQNQTDDQMCIQNENERLQSRLAVLEAQLVQQQQQSGGTAALFAPVAMAVASGDAQLVLAQATTQTPASGSDSEKLQLNEQIAALQTRLERAQQETHAQHQRNVELDGELQAALAQRADEAEQLRRLAAELAAVQPRIDEATAERAARDEQIRELRERIDNAPVQAGAVQEPVVVRAVQTQQVQAVPAVQAVQAQAQVAHLEQYINDLQIQLRIATNDCEQLAQTQQSLEEEIQQRQRGYDQHVGELQAQLQQQQKKQHQQQHQQPPQDPSQLAIESAMLSSIESQIIPQLANAPAASTSSAPAVPSFDGAMFFGHTTASDAPFDRLTEAAAGGVVPLAVEETAIVPKTAYVCHDGSDADDGWGFGSDEAALEEQHQAQQQQQQLQQQATPQPTVAQLDQLERELAAQQTELTAVRTDNAQLQLKSAKMLKKLKEYKARNDELLAVQQQQHMSRSSSASLTSGSSDLDLAIQEELNVQIRGLEARLKELRTEHETIQLERTGLLKRCDTLTAANDRLTDMKERQDADMEACRRQQRQLQQQLDQMQDWQADDDDSGAASRTTSSATNLATAEPTAHSAPDAIDPIAVPCPNCIELQNEVAELQACLDAEKEHIVVLEARITKLSSSLDVDAVAANENARLHHRLSESVATIDTLAGDATSIRQHLDQLRVDHREKLEENRLLTYQFASMRDQLADMKRQLAESERNAMSLEAGERLERRCEQLTALVQMREAEVEHLNERVVDALAGAQRAAEAELELSRRGDEVRQLRGQIDELLLERRTVKPNPAKVEEEERVDVQTVELEQQAAAHAVQLADLLADKQQMEHELAVLNDQVISSLNLEDDMRSMRLQQDAKTIEIAELKASLAHMVQQQSQPASSAPATPSTADVEARLNAHWELVLEQRCAELADRWRQHMTDREDQFAAQLARHPTESSQTQTSPKRGNPPVAADDGGLEPNADNVQDAETTALRRELEQLNHQLAVVGAENERLVQLTLTSSSEPDRQRTLENAPGVAAPADTAQLVANMQQALETQELEIVTLKEQLAVRSAEYARLAAQVDPFGSGVVVQKAQTPSAASPPQRRREPTPKSELDLALYMLHQRDMRCEELTEELMSMLEERDQLQLKLAGSMRHNERLRMAGASAAGDEVHSSEVDSADITPEMQLAGGSERSTPPPPSARHKTLRDEREQHQRQMAILQRDVSTLPPEAVAELMAGTDYDPSIVDRQRQRLSSAGRDGGSASGAAGAADAADESPYTALLNLFWGPRAPANEST